MVLSAVMALDTGSALRSPTRLYWVIAGPETGHAATARGPPFERLGWPCQVLTVLFASADSTTFPTKS